jgi:hypothetical protein
MGCFVLLFAIISPRLAIIATWLLTDILSRAFDGWILPFIGFFLLPWTTLAYAWMWENGTNTVNGFEWFIVGIAFLADLSSHGGSARSRS